MADHGGFDPRAAASLPTGWWRRVPIVAWAVAAAAVFAGCSGDAPTTPAAGRAAPGAAGPTAGAGGSGGGFVWSVEVHDGGGDFRWAVDEVSVAAGATGSGSAPRGFFHGELQQPVLHFVVSRGGGDGPIRLSLVSRTAPEYRPFDSPFRDSFGDGEAYVYVGGYGGVTVEARDEGTGARSRFRFEVGDPADNAADIETVRYAGEHSLPVVPVLARTPPTCNGSIRESALRYTGRIWSGWRLPIPVDLVDNFPKDRVPWIWSGEVPTDYHEAFDLGRIREQVEAYAEQIERNLGFAVIEMGEVISEETLDAQGGADRPRRMQRFHLGYRVGDCPFGFTAACAHIERGFASWAARASVGDFGEAIGVAHEIEHLLGFKHEYNRFDQTSLVRDGVAMDEPAYLNFLPGQRYWTGNHEWRCGLVGPNRNAATGACYKEWDDSRYTASATLANLYCIFEPQSR